jgi:hypothetical protein
LGENIPAAEFGIISEETACWDISQIFNEDFYLPPLSFYWLEQQHAFAWKYELSGCV